MDKLDRAVEMVHNGIDELGGVMKLQFGVSTGAVAFFVHAVFEKSEGPLIVGILSAATVCFGVAGILCLNALTNFSTVKTGLGVLLSGTTKDERGNPKDHFKEFEQRVALVSKKFGLGNRFFYGGLILSAALLVTKFVMTLRHAS